MSSLQKYHDVDLEAAKFDDNCFCDDIDSGCHVKEIVEKYGSRKERKVSNLTECSVALESGIRETRACSTKTEKDCRICHQSLQNQESGVPIELGCSCKDDLAAAHKHCAETWFKIKGNKTCEICNSVAQNIVGIPEAELVTQWSETNDIHAVMATRLSQSESRKLRKGHWILIFIMFAVCGTFLSWRFIH